MQRRVILILSIVLCAGCSGQGAHDGAPGEAIPPPHPATPAGFALAYRAGDEGTDRLIARAQARVRIAPGQADAHVGLAQAFIQKRRETGDPAYLVYARDAMGAAQSLAPGDFRVLTGQIVLDFDSHRFARAAQLAEKAIAAEPASPDGYLLLSDARLELGDYEGAVSALQEAMDRAPDLRSHGRAGYLRWLHGDVEGALDAMDEAVSPGSRTAEPMAWCYVEIGLMLWHGGKLDPARRSAQRALSLLPNYLPALSLDARVLASLGRDEEAIARLEGVVARAPTADALLRLSELLAGAGRELAAGRYLARAEKLASDDPVPVALYYARHGIWPERALALAERAVAERATIYSRDALAMALLRAGRVDAAQKAMAEAHALATPDARLILHRALIEFASGDRSAATASLNAASIQNPHADPLLARELAALVGQPFPGPPRRAR